MASMHSAIGRREQLVGAHGSAYVQPASGLAPTVRSSCTCKYAIDAFMWKQHEGH